MKLPKIDNKFKEPDLKDEPSPFQNREARNQKQYNWNSLRKWGGGFASIFEDILGQFINTLKEMIDHFNDMVANPANKDVDMSEVRIARKPQGKDAYPTLGDRLDTGDEVAKNLADRSLDLNQNMLRVNENSKLANMQVITKFIRKDVTRVFQGAAFDSKGNLYLAEQTDSAGSQLINKYDPKTGELIQSRDLRLTEVVWLEGNSLIEDSITGEIKFIVPINVKGSWLIYDFDNDTKSDVFKLEGVPKYCIDNTGQYFLTTQTQYNIIGDVNDIVIGFNVYDLESIMALKPEMIKFISVKDSIVHGANKIQGIQMVDDYIYIGRGTDKQWFRTTVVNSSGVLINDFNWDKQDLNKLFGFEGNISVESEGFCFTNIDGKSVPVMNFLLAGGGNLSYAMVGLGIDNGIMINYTAGASMASLTRQEKLGSMSGLTFIAGGNPSDESILAKFSRIKELGTYSFTASENNIGLSANMKTTNGIVVVREVANGLVTKASVIATDYDNVMWTCYCVNGTWSRWANAGGMPAHIVPFDFDPLITNSGTYRTGSTVNAPKGAGNALIYQIHDSIGYKVITCYDTNHNEQYQRTFMPNGFDSGWKKLSSVSVASTAYQLMTTQAALKTAQAQNAQMAYQIMKIGGA